jgi:hypothetical protein
MQNDPILATFDTTPSPHGRINAPSLLLAFAHIHGVAGTPTVGICSAVVGRNGPLLSMCRRGGFPCKTTRVDDGEGDVRGPESDLELAQAQRACESTMKIISECDPGGQITQLGQHKVGLDGPDGVLLRGRCDRYGYQTS